jgi:quercetin dioxygenase-like cupin family protein
MATSKDLNVLVEQLRSGAVPTVDVAGQPILCVTVFETAHSQASVYLLQRDQRIPAHRHSAVEDVLVGVTGQGRIRIWSLDGDYIDCAVEPGWVVVVEPGRPHEVVCIGDEFGYLLTQGPIDKYDNVSYNTE